MFIGPIDTAKQVLVIAEIGNNHEGNFDLAVELIGLAKEAGVGAVKFQTFRPAEYVNRSDEARFQRLTRFAFTAEQFQRLAEIATGAGLLFLSTPFDLTSVGTLAPIVPAFKIGSGENTFYPLIERAARVGKPILLSCGVSELADILYAKALIEKTWRTAGVESELAVLHCVSSYPTPLNEANLSAIRTLHERLGCEVGYSDHTIGIDAAVLSVGVGARIIEKHFTIDHNYSDFRDHQLSADPREMKELVKRVNDAAVMLGSGRKEVSAVEQGMVKAMRRSIVAKRDLPIGHVITWNDLNWVRPAGGLAPGGESMLLGRILAAPLKEGEHFTLEGLR